MGLLLEFLNLILIGLIIPVSGGYLAFEGYARLFELIFKTEVDGIFLGIGAFVFIGGLLGTMFAVMKFVNWYQFWGV